MVISAERAKILEMVERGQVSAEEGARLLGALEREGETRVNASEQSARWLHIRVSDLDTGRPKVNVNVPFELVKVGLQIGSRFAPDIGDLDMDEFVAELQSGVPGSLIEVEDEEGGEQVEIYLD
ncbi:MAG: hypothetical protein J7M16_00985 [Anaerolineae bacterium]|nr:hypothetical protein [Anaerolineae bacterium]